VHSVVLWLSLTLKDLTFLILKKTENYLLALCKKDQKYHLERLLEIVDITKVRSSDLLANIFEYLGRFSLDSVASRFLWELRESGKAALSNNMFMPVEHHFYSMFYMFLINMRR